MTRDRKLHRRRAAGFTLVEILLVVVIIGILVGVALPRLGGRKRQAEIAAAKADIEAITTSLNLYEIDVGEYPKQMQDLVTTTGSEKWNGPYLQKGMPKDPWNHDYLYVCPGARNPQTFDLSSYGPDGVESADDISNWKTGE